VFNIFKLNKQTNDKFLSVWQPIMQRAKAKMPEQLPDLPRKFARVFIEEWNTQYENSDENEKIGLAVLAYRVDIHRYAAGMLIDSDSGIRLSGIRILGYMRDESSWPVLTALLGHSDKTVAMTAMVSLFQINERRAKDELSEEITSRPDWTKEYISQLLEPVCDTEFLLN
jgi:hypothetical protein